MNSLAILGGGGHGMVVADAALKSGWKNISFFDDSLSNGAKIGEWFNVGGSGDLLRDLSNYDGIIVAIGDNKVRLEKTLEFISLNARVVSVIHPFSNVGSLSVVGRGSVICPGSVIGVNAKIGVASIVNTSATIDHDCLLGDGVHISPGANVCGSVEVGDCSWIGAGSVIKNNLTIGHNSVVGAGAVVINCVGSRISVAGNPAGLIARRSGI